MESKKIVILAASILLIISIGVYSQFFNELEGIPIQEEEQRYSNSRRRTEYSNSRKKTISSNNN